MRCARRLDARRPTSTRTGTGCRRSSSASRASCAPRTASTSRAAARIMVTAGANMAFMHAVLAITEPGDEIILPVPFYFNHEMAIQMAGCRAVTVPTDDRLSAATSTPSRRAITDRTRAIVTISPNNPSGAVFPEALAPRGQRPVPRSRAVPHRRRGLRVLHLRDRPGTCRPARLPAPTAHTISLYSLSKAYGFAGWRIGYIVYPDAPRRRRC